MSKKDCILFNLTSNMTFALAPVLMDLKRYSPNLVDEIVIFSDGISPKDQSLLNSILPCRFLEYKFPIEDLSRYSSTVVDYFTPMVFARYEAFRLLSEYRCIIILDYDIVIKDDIRELKSYASSGFATAKECAKLGHFFKQAVPNYDMEVDSQINNPWILWDHLPYSNEIYERCYQMTLELANYLYLPETGIIALVLIEFGIVADRFFETAIYNCHPRDENENAKAKIVHAWGQPKFWNGLHYGQWESNYRTWLSLGGTPYSGRSFQSKLKNFYGRVKNFLKVRLNQLSKGE